MRTRQMHFKRQVQRQLHPDTLVKLPAKYLSEDGASHTEIGIGCDICFLSEAFDADIYCAAEDVVTAFPLQQLDFRLPYYFGDQEKTKAREELTQYDEYRLFIMWYELKDPANPELVTMINHYRTKRNYPDMFQNNDGRVQTWGVIMDHNHHSDDDSGNEDNTDEPVGSQHPLNENNADDIILCSNCYHWFSMLHTECADRFKSTSTAEISYQQWLEEHEDELIV